MIFKTLKGYNFGGCTILAGAGPCKHELAKKNSKKLFLDLEGHFSGRGRGHTFEQFHFQGKNANEVVKGQTIKCEN